MRSPLIGLLVATLASTIACGSSAPPAPTPPVAAPAPAPAPSPSPTAAARVLKYEVVTVGRPSGEAEIRIEPDGRRLTHFTFNDRGRGPDVRTEITVDETGALRRFRATGHNYLKAPIDERLDDQRGTLSWTSSTEKGQAPSTAGQFVPINDFDVTLVRALLRAKDHRLALLPAGQAWIDDDVAREIEIGGVKRRLRFISVAGLGFQPGGFWLDEDNEFFASVSPWISIVRTGATSVVPELLAADEAWTSARAARLAGKLAHRPPAAGLAITHARLFDSVRRTIVPDATVIVVGDRITAVGNAKTPIPAGAQVIDAGGRTLIPGLWDMHVHIFDGDGLLHLASGVTTVRDLGNDFDQLSARLKRIAAGTEIAPSILRAGLIDGPGPFAAPTGVLASTPEEATAAVKKFADAGYQQIKLYSSLKPELVPVVARAAHARGLRLSGHIPTGMNAAQAVEAGYDEIQHVNMLFLRFLAQPGDDTRTPVRFTRVAEHATDLDLAGPEVKKFFDLLLARKTVLDPTVAVFQDMFVSDPGELDPILAPYEQRLPAQILRGGRNGGLPAPDGKRAQYRASYGALLRMVKAAWDRKIPIVAGTDNIAGLTLTHELELYVQAGIPAPEVLALASIGAARVMGVDRDVGSIARGKRADLVLVDGDPTKDITALRNTRTVVCRGVVYDPAELFTEVGMRP